MIKQLFLTSIALFLLKLSIAQVEKPYQKDEDDNLVININYDTWLTVPEKISLRPISLGFSFGNFYDLKFGKSNFSLGLGYGFHSHNVHQDGKFIDSSEVNQTFLVPRKQDFKKNKYVVNYLDIPIELRFKTKTRRTFRIAIGVKAGWLLSDHTKTIDEDGKRKFYNLNRTKNYQYGLTGRIGYGDFNFFMYYGLTSIFEDGKGPELIPFSLGFSIVPF